MGLFERHKATDPVPPDMGLLVIGVGLELVEECDVRPIVEWLESVSGFDQAASEFFERLDLVFEGFEKDPREIWEIAEVRRFARQLDARWHYWLFFMSKLGTGLQGLMLCLLEPGPTGAFSLDTPQASELMDRWISGMNEMCALAGLPQAEVLDLTRRSMEYLLQGPEDD